ncbi:hypothetical protein ACHAPU_004690 [Fusarium lateritium]
MSNMAESQSDESENEMQPVQSQSQDESSENESSDESSDDSDGGGLLDTMAADTDDDSSDEPDAQDNDHDQNGLNHTSSTGSFSQFCRLPTELQYRIWELFCPELSARYRVLDFLISYGTMRHPDSATSLVWTIRDGIALEDQTRNLRTIFAVHQASRALATNAFPNSLSIDAGTGDAIVAFNRNSDVILVNGLTCPPGKNVFHLPEFASEIKNLALGGPDILDDLSGSDVPTLLNQFTQLESFYVSISSTDCQKSTLGWCTSELVNHYRTQTYEKQPGLGEDLQFLWCWPNLQRHPDFARFQIDRDTWDNLPDPTGSTLERRGLKAWPMVAFEYERGLRRYEMLQTLGPDLGDDTSSDEEDDDEDNGSNLDEYESDGIDDNEIVETYDDSDEEGISLASGSPGPARQQIQEVSDDEEEDEDDGVAGVDAGANFSSPEPDEEPESVPVQRGRKRRVVSDSDDEEEEDVQPSKRARIGRVVDSDDEDEGDEPEISQGVPSHNRSRTIISDDEDEDDASEQGGVSRQPDADDASGSSEDSEEESDESEDEDAPPAKMSLAERLRMHREENPVNNRDSDDDGSSRTADADSEDEDEDQERNPFLAGMADESDGEGDDDDEDDY